MEKIKFFEVSPGNASNSRVIADIIIISAIALAEQVLLFRGDAGIMVAATAAGTIFLTVGGPALAFLFAQKKSEIKKIETENNK